MKYAYFKISAVFPNEDAEKLNAFLTAQIIASFPCSSVGMQYMTLERLSMDSHARAWEPESRNHNIGFRLAGGSVNQQRDLFRYGQQYPVGQIQGLRCVSRLSTQSLPSGRFF